MDSKNVSLEDLIKRDKQNRKGGFQRGGRGGRVGGPKFGNRPAGGNQVPRFRERAGIFKPRRTEEIVLPPRSGQAGQATGEGPRMKRVSGCINLCVCVRCR